MYIQTHKIQFIVYLMIVLHENNCLLCYFHFNEVDFHLKIMFSKRFTTKFNKQPLNKHNLS